MIEFSYVNPPTTYLENPPIILDVSSLAVSEIPYSDVEGTLQLVEGHSRLGYLCNIQL